MKAVIKSTSGKKAVRISYNEFNGYICCYYAIDELNQTEIVIERKSYSTEKRAVSYANKVLNK